MMSQSSPKPDKKTIYLVRHGETEFNRQGLVQGSGVDSDLNETGLRQAELFYEAYGDIPFDHVYTSSLKRTLQSVQRFIDDGIPHTAMAGLNEISWGDYEGRVSIPDWREEYWHMIGQWQAGNLEYRVAMGENPLELQDRQKPVLEHLLTRPDQSIILICMHGRAMKSLLCLMLDKPLSEMEDFQHHNLCLYVLEYENGLFSIVKNNDQLHLGKLAAG